MDITPSVQLTGDDDHGHHISTTEFSKDGTDPKTPWRKHVRPSLASVTNAAMAIKTLSVENKQMVQGRGSRLSWQEDELKQSRVISKTRHANWFVVDEEETASFIKDKIKQRICPVFVRQQETPKQKGQDSSLELCQCGKERRKHDHDGSQEPKDKWEMDKHTQEKECECFGKIEFKGFGSSTTTSLYTRVAADTPFQVVWELLIKHWKMPPPRLVISVTGGAKNFDLNPKLNSLLKQGLIEAAVNTGAWIITGGTAAGVMGFVGEAVKDHMMVTGRSSEDQCVALGIAPWGCVAKKQVLEGKKGKGQWPAKYTKDDDSNTPTKGKGDGNTTAKSKGVLLDPNHTHFLLVDDGSHEKFGREIKFRSLIESYISKVGTTEVSDESKVISTPVVVVVVEGGIGTIDTAYQALKQKTPVVVIKGSGRAADLMAYAFSTKEKEAGLEKRAKDIFARENVKEKDLKNAVEHLKECRKWTELINVFDPEKSTSVKDIDRMILCAILKAEKGKKEMLGQNLVAQLKLALAWNRCDVAQKDILTRDNRKKLQSDSLKEVMLMALVDNRPDFVELFIDNGVDLKKFLTWKQLADLYNKCLEAENDREVFILEDMISLVKKRWLPCCGPKYSEKGDEGRKHSNILALINKVITRLLENASFQRYKDKDNKDNKECENDAPELDLFVFSILFNRQRMAHLFLKQGVNHISTALFGCSILKALSIETEDEDAGTSENLMRHSKILEGFAMDVLKECYRRSKTDAHLLLVREIQYLKNTNILLFVDQQELMDFANSPACQTKLTSMWRDSLDVLSRPWIFATVLCPLLVFSIKFKVADSSKFCFSQNKVDKDQESTQGALANINELRNPHELKEVTCLMGNKSIWWPRAFYKFYSAPVTKFATNMIAYLILLALFSYFLLTNVKPMSEPDSPSGIECLVWVWFATMCIEEIRQVVTRKQGSIRYNIKDWSGNLWNLLDFIIYSGVIVSIILRFVLTESKFVWVRIIYTITLVLSYLRFMQFFQVDKNIGPKIIMIKKMLTDLMFFFMILLVFVLSFGVAYHVNMFPNSPVTWSILATVLYYPYYQIYGELFLEDLGGDDVNGCTRNETIWQDDPTQRCPEENPVVLILLAVYMVLTNILLVNLLIAMFSYTFQLVQENSTKVWRFYRISLIHEYFDRPTLMPPLIILNHLWQLMRYSFDCLPNHKKTFVVKMDEDDLAGKKLTLLENAAKDVVVAHRTVFEREHIDKKMATSAERQEAMMDDLQRIKDLLQKQSEQVETDTALKLGPETTSQAVGDRDVTRSSKKDTMSSYSTDLTSLSEA